MATKPLVVCIDDNLAVAKALKLALSGEPFDFLSFEGSAQFWKMPAVDFARLAAVIVDYKLSEGDSSLELIRSLKRKNPSATILVYSGDASREALKESLLAGAQDFLQKSLGASSILDSIRKAAAEYHLVDTHSVAADPIIFGISATSQKQKEKITAASKHRHTVLLVGESGTGKELLARRIHGDKDKTFFPVNCAAYGDGSQLLEAELFGVEKGAYTGADRSREGILEAAGSGTVFLDEIHTLALPAQAKLLRVLQEKKIRRVGGTTETPVSCRFIASAKPAIEEMTKRGEFLVDLYIRLCVFPIVVAPLRERTQDIPELVAHFSHKYREGRGAPLSFTPEAIDLLKIQHWPGNIRELEHLVLRHSISHGQNPMGVEDLDLLHTSEHAVTEDEDLSTLKARHRMEEDTMIASALASSGGKLRAAARLLNVPTATLSDRIKRSKK